MKKVVTVHLANEVFQMEEDGFIKIQRVLRKIETGSSNGPVLVKEIEQKIADMLRQKMVNNLITEAQVEEVLTSLGYAGYFRSGEYTHYTAPEYKRLFRHPTDKVLGGVCSGIAFYINTDPVLIRALFVVMFFLGGTGLLLYLILWLVVPQAHSLDQMYGNR